MELGALTQRVQDTHHAYINTEMPRLSTAFRNNKVPDALMLSWYALQAVLSDHLMKEESILFPRFKAIASGEGEVGCGIDGPIMQMRKEHDEIRELEAQLRKIAAMAGPEQGALIAFLDDLAVHARTEDELLFPSALRMTGADVDVSAHPIVGACHGAMGAHVRIRTTVQSLHDDFAQRDLTKRLSAPWAHFIKGIEEHMKEEEEILFPALLALAEGKEPASDEFLEHLAEMEYERGQVQTIADALRNAAPEAGDREADLLELLDLLDLHAMREEEELYPRGMELVDAWKKRKAAAAPPAAPRVVTPAASAHQASAHQASAAHAPERKGGVLRQTARAILDWARKH